MTEEARKYIKGFREVEFKDCIDFPYAACTMLHTAADLIESLSAQLDQVTRERDGLQMELDELKEEYYTDIHTARDPMLDKVKQLERERDAAVEDMTLGRICATCRYHNNSATSKCMGCLSWHSNYQWRGVEVEDVHA